MGWRGMVASWAGAALAAGAVLSAPAARAAASFPAIAICEDENEWPPYSYFQRVNGNRTSNVVGYAVDVIAEILGRYNIRWRIDMIPWQRCLAVARLGKQYQLTLNMSWSEERARDFLFSKPYYSTTTYYYYSRKRNPQGLAVNSPADLHNYRLCGVRGYNYAGYGLQAGEVDQGASDFKAMIAKLHLGRCALFVEKNEVMLGYTAIGKDYLADPDLGLAPVPGMPPGLFHFAIPKTFPQAQALLQVLDGELTRMQDSGRLQALWAKAVGPSAGRRPPVH